MSTLRVAALAVYPLKGAAGIPLDEAVLDDFGIRHDRRWMIVDHTGRFVSQREHARLALLHTAIDSDSVTLRSSAGELQLPFEPVGPTRTVRVWSDTVPATDCGDDAAAYVSALLGIDARIVHMPRDVHRQADTTYAEPGDRVSFVDGFPLLLIGQASLDALNQQLEQPVGMRRFRPNVVVDGTAPHEEDTWHRIRIGDVACDVVKPCARCAVPTIDPDTGIAGREPIRTLARYRQWQQHVYFGQNIVHRATGTLRTGDVVAVHSTRTAAPPLA